MTKIFCIFVLWFGLSGSVIGNAIPSTYFNNSVLKNSDMLQEIFKSVKGYEGLYEVSNLGRVKSLPGNGNPGNRKQTVIMKCLVTPLGYIRLMLSKDGRKFHSVHRLVAKAFIPNPENKATVNHKDGNPSNNHIDNLEWNTRSENQKHSFRVLGRNPVKSGMGKFGKLNGNSIPVLQYTLDGVFVNEFECRRGAERQTGINYVGICKVVNGNRKHAGGYFWKNKT